LYPVGEDGREVALSLFSMDKNKQIPKNLYTKWFDYDKIKNGLVLRYRQNGDYLVIRGGFKKALRRILVDEKIPQSCRDSMILLAEGNHILWIPDMGRISEYYKVTEATRRILSAELKENEDEGKN
jgi:tRNA(Ile)-lysidine synthase